MINKSKYIKISENKNNTENENIFSNSLDDISPLSISPQMISYRINYNDDYDIDNNNYDDIDFFDKYKKYNIRIKHYIAEIQKNDVNNNNDTIIKDLSYLFLKIISLNDCIEKKDIYEVCHKIILEKIEKIEKIGEKVFFKLISYISKLLKKKLAIIKKNININNTNISSILENKKNDMFFKIATNLLKLINIEILDNNNIDIIIKYYLDDININNIDDKEHICFLFKYQIHNNITIILNS